MQLFDNFFVFSKKVVIVMIRTLKISIVEIHIEINGLKVPIV